MADILSSHETEKFVTCPYNRAHSIVAKRMQTHLTKCRRQHPNVEMIECIYNAKHRIPKPEESFHLDTCIDRKNLDKFVYVREDVNCDKYKVPQLEEIQSTECWDDNFSTYNPTAYCESKPILRNVSTLSAGARKEFRESERRRIQDLRNMEHAAYMQSGPSSSRQPNQMNSFSSKLKQIDEDDPYKVQALMQKMNNERVLHEQRVSVNTTTSTWGNMERDRENHNTDNSDFPPLGSRDPRRYGGRGRGRV